MTESLANTVISTCVRGELKISEAKSFRENRFLLRRNDKKKEFVIGSAELD